jgi:hypothetical protein
METIAIMQGQSILMARPHNTPSKGQLELKDAVCHSSFLTRLAFPQQPFFRHVVCYLTCQLGLRLSIDPPILLTKYVCLFVCIADSHTV